MDQVVTALRIDTTAPDPGRSSSDFEAFFADQHEPLFRALALLTRNRHEAEEVLPDADLRLLQEVHASLRSDLVPQALPSRPLHGSPHEGNWLATASGPLLLDFETASRGPLEWDLSALGDDVALMFPGVDRDLLATLRRMRSLCVAVKCWIQPDRAPEVFEAAHVHLLHLRGEPVS